MLISFDSILEYQVCPYKLHYDTVSPTVNPITELYKNLVHQSLLYVGKNNKFSHKTFNVIFNTVWSSLKHRLPSVDSALYINLKNKVSGLYQSIFRDMTSLVAVGYISALDVGADVLQVDIAAVFTDKNKNLWFLFQYDESGYQFSDTSLLNALYNYVTKRVSKQDFGTHMEVNAIVLKTQNAITYKISSSKSLSQLKPIVSSFIDTFKLNKLYPIATDNNCTNCGYKKHCQWLQ